MKAMNWIMHIRGLLKEILQLVLYIIVSISYIEVIMYDGIVGTK